MNILLINHYAGSNRHGMEFRPYCLAREWVRLGHSVTIAAASCSHLRVQAPSVRGNRSEEEIDGIRYVWFKTPRYRGNRMQRALNIFSFVGQLMRHEEWIQQQCCPDVVIASSTYPLDIIPAYRLARRRSRPLIFEVHDLWPLSPIELGGMSPRHPFIRLMQWAENFAYRHADRVVSLLPQAASHMELHGMASHKFVHVPNGVDVTEWQSNEVPIPELHRDRLSCLRNAGKFIVGYTGSHGEANELRRLIDAAQLLRGEPVAIVLVGQGCEKQKLQERAAELALDNLIFLPPILKPAIPSLLASMDALFIGWHRREIYRYGICPNKLMDYMMAGKPVIHAVAAGNDLVAETGCGISVAPEDPAQIANAIRRLMRLPATERAALGLRGKEHVITHHDYPVLARRFLALTQ